MLEIYNDMEKEKAKEFLVKNRNKIYLTKDFDKALEKTEHQKAWEVFAVVDTEIGEKLFNMEYSYSGEPIIMGTRMFVHKEYFLKYYGWCEIIKL